MSSTRKGWTRDARTGVYTFDADPRLTVATYCECSYSGCGVRWSAYWDRGYAPESIPTQQHAYLADALASAVAAYESGADLAALVAEVAR